MCIAQQDPLLARHVSRADLAVRQTPVLRAAEHEGTRVARVVDDLPGATVQKLRPHELALVRPALQATREEQLLRMELLDHRQTGAGSFETLEEQAHGRLHLGVRVEDDAIVDVVHEADGHSLLELAAASSAQDAAAKTRLEHMELRFTHRALQPQEQSVVEVRRIIQPVFIEDERVAERTELEQPMPVGGVARKTRHLQAEDDADATETDLGDEALEALAVGGTRPGLAEIAVDDDDAIERPTKCNGTVAQRVLTQRALGVLQDLAQRRLTHIQVGHAREVRGRDLLMSLAVQ